MNGIINRCMALWRSLPEDVKPVRWVLTPAQWNALRVIWLCERGTMPPAEDQMLLMGLPIRVRR
jgi:hypothetical protein